MGEPSDKDLPLAPHQTWSFLAGAEAKEEKRSRIEMKWVQSFWAGQQEICDGSGDGGCGHMISHVI